MESVNQTFIYSPNIDVMFRLNVRVLLCNFTFVVIYCKASNLSTVNNKKKTNVFDCNVNCNAMSNYSETQKLLSQTLNESAFSLELFTVLATCVIFTTEH